MASFQPGIRRAIAQLSRSSFICRQCLRSQRPFSPSSSPSPILSSLRVASRRYESTVSQPAPTSSLAGKVTAAAKELKAQSASQSSSKSSSSSFPDHNSKSVGIFLIASAASVFGIIVLGGLTRLTESGLSITEWKPVTGSLPPLSSEDWQSEFDKYRASPEFKVLNPHMDLSEFKKIYYMEWTHRLWGRFIGLSFVLPTIYFIARRRVTKRMAFGLVGISGLIGFQGVIGWWMVKSGLRDDLFAPGSYPRVSQYRLAAHLAAAFACYSAMLLAGISVLRTHRLVKDPAAGAAALKALQSPALVPLRRYVTALTALVFLTAMSGALVAGLDAGLIYNEFPKMGLGLTPPRSELWSDFYSRREDGSDIWWRNMLENPSLVQLDHRILATTTFFAVMALLAYSRTGRIKAALPKDVRKGVMGMVHLVSLQVALGISTLIYMVPTHLAATHQAGAVALLSGALLLGSRMRVSPRTIKLVQKRLLTK
ncbi:cytochrome oxidase assembly protein-domain-containing protein [Coniochaeta sp. 2T2.1]|nr:cytochrome oxidase assembly protein-domain-containing protein [Coniochaeta sp. 2T2.1]